MSRDTPRKGSKQSAPSLSNFTTHSPHMKFDQVSHYLFHDLKADEKSRNYLQHLHHKLGKSLFSKIVDDLNYHTDIDLYISHLFALETVKQAEILLGTKFPEAVKDRLIDQHANYCMAEVLSGNATVSDAHKQLTSKTLLPYKQSLADQAIHAIASSDDYAGLTRGRKQEVRGRIKLLIINKLSRFYQLPAENIAKAVKHFVGKYIAQAKAPTTNAGSDATSSRASPMPPPDTGTTLRTPSPIEASALTPADSEKAKALSFDADTIGKSAPGEPASLKPGAGS